ncbi:hypothetical protein Pmani_014608 [Petrolisthes manimaculis]|uniref:Tryptophan--tRNA ligase, mitochondrial n=1 Tax=Petrolisthes manimaculis TaxID=1843537 RepID=A0AAE1PW38_9EUCA|nr:hypothetical protein Pmani_023288 [Petrolisthes manimaculis]KAK4314077.1 hypothetical protein Pmani_014608 [Petrolisthes manimaculis]
MRPQLLVGWTHPALPHLSTTACTASSLARTTTNSSLFKTTTTGSAVASLCSLREGQGLQKGLGVVSKWQEKCHIHTDVRLRSEEGTTHPSRRIIFSGIQPTGVVHLGNYLGAVRQWVELQKGGDDVIFCVVDQHAITLAYDHTTLPAATRATVASLIACGVDPDTAVLYQQSRVPEHAELNWVLTCLTTMARLTHLPQYKEKSQSLREVPLGLYAYPVLQAADILLYRATHVPVGEDQRQHIQLAAHLARVFNNRYGETFTLPRSLVADTAAARIRSLRHPDKKMSKSEANPRGRIDLTDTPDIIRGKFKKAVTDFTSAVYYDPENRPGVSNLMAIHSEVTGQSFEDITEASSGLTTAQYKLVVADAVIELLNPIRLKLDALLADPAQLTALMDRGAERARERAVPTWQEVKRKVGLAPES